MSHEIYRMIQLLEEAKIHFRLGRRRDDGIMITATMVGERVEIDVFEDGHVEYSRFRGDEAVQEDIPALEALVRQYADP